jgi:hypothetical protein
MNYYYLKSNNFYLNLILYSLIYLLTNDFIIKFVRYFYYVEKCFPIHIELYRLILTLRL